MINNECVRRHMSPRTALPNGEKLGDESAEKHLVSRRWLEQQHEQSETVEFFEAEAIANYREVAGSGATTILH